MSVPAGPSVSPVRVEGDLDLPLKRWMPLVKWALAIPHWIVLAFLWLGFFFTSIVAFFAILFTGRYPRGIFGYGGGVLRWAWRVGFYSYSAPRPHPDPPFSLADDPSYPARLDVAYPEAPLSRGLVLIKWWLLAIPHYIVVAVFAGGGASAASDMNGGWARVARGGGPRGGRGFSRPPRLFSPRAPRGRSTLSRRALPAVDLRLRARDEPVGLPRGRVCRPDDGRLSAVPPRHGAARARGRAVARAGDRRRLTGGRERVGVRARLGVQPREVRRLVVRVQPARVRQHPRRAAADRLGLQSPSGLGAAER